MEEIKTIKDRLLSEWQNLVLVFPLSRTDKEVAGRPMNYRTFKAYTFRVATWNSLLRTDIDVGSIASSTGQSYGALNDGSGNEILRNEDQPWTMYHYSVGVQEDDIRIYPRAPSSQMGGGLTYLGASNPDPTTPDDYGFIPGSQSDYWDPCVELENVSFATGVNTDIDYGFYNTNPDHEINPTVSVVGRTYITLPIADENEKRRIVSGDIPRTMVTWGHAVRDSFSSNVPSIWEDSGCGVEIDSADVRSGGRPGRG